MGDRGTRRSSLQSAKTGFQIFQPQKTAEWVTNFVMHLSTILRDFHIFFSGGSTLHCLDQIFDQEELLHLEQRLLHQFPLALVIPPAASPPRLPRGLRLLLHHLRPHTHPWGETVQAARHPIRQPPRQLEEGRGGNPGQKWKWEQCPGARGDKVWETWRLFPSKTLPKQFTDSNQNLRDQCPPRKSSPILKQDKSRCRRQGSHQGLYSSLDCSGCCCDCSAFVRPSSSCDNCKLFQVRYANTRKIHSNFYVNFVRFKDGLCIKVAKNNPFIQIGVLGLKFDNDDLSAHFFTMSEPQAKNTLYPFDGLC